MVAIHGGHAHGSAEPGMNAASAANSEPDATTNTNDAFKPFRLFDLPVEVQDMVMLTRSYMYQTLANQSPLDL